MRRRELVVAIAALTAGCAQEEPKSQDESEVSTPKAETRWSYDDADQGIRDILATEDAYYLLDEENHLIKVLQKTGEQQWYTSIDHTISRKPFTAGDFIIFTEIFNGTPKYHIYDTGGDLQSTVDVYQHINKYMSEYATIGTSQHIIITSQTITTGEGRSLSAYIIDPATGEMIDSKKWNAYAGVSARIGSGYIIVDGGTIQRVNNSYEPLWSTSAEYNRPRQVTITDQKEIIVEVVDEESAGIIHLSKDGKIINQVEFRGDPDEEITFCADSVTTSTVTILPTCTDTSGATFQKYNHKQRSVTDKHTIEGELGTGELISMVSYDGSVLFAVDGSTEDIHHDGEQIEFRRLDPSNFTISNSWILDSVDRGDLIQTGDNTATYVEDDSISRILLES